MASVSAVVARFQVPELHGGHRHLLDFAANNGERLLVFLGVSSQRNTLANPLNFDTRKQMVQAAYPNALVLPILDRATNEEWSADLDRKIRELTDEHDLVTLFSGPAGFIQSYCGNYPVEAVPKIPSTTGTVERRSVTKTPRHTADFRAGIIYAAETARPLTAMAVDVALYRYYKGDFEILLGKKPSGWCLPGGYLDFTDSSLEQAAWRELREETGVMPGPQPPNVTIKMEYLFSKIVDTWRYRGAGNMRIMTTVFALSEDYMSFDDILDDEFSEVTYFAENQLRDMLDEISPEHQEIIFQVFQRLKAKRPGMI